MVRTLGEEREGSATFRHKRFDASTFIPSPLNIWSETLTLKQPRPAPGMGKLEQKNILSRKHKKGKIAGKQAQKQSFVLNIIIAMG